MAGTDQERGFVDMSGYYGTPPATTPRPGSVVKPKNAGETYGLALAMMTPLEEPKEPTVTISTAQFDAMMQVLNAAKAMRYAAGIVMAFLCASRSATNTMPLS